MLHWLGCCIFLLPVVLIAYQKISASPSFTNPNLVFFGILLLLYLIGLSRFAWKDGGMPKVRISSLAIGMVAAVATYVISVNLGYGPFIASGIVGIVAAWVLANENAVIAYTAAFAGMSSGGVVTSVLAMAAVGILVGLIFDITLDKIPGVGGRLGTIAAAAVIIVVFFV